MPASTRTTRHRHTRDTNRDEHLAVMADLFGMLSDRSRLRILIELAQSPEACVSDLAQHAHISESAVSHALRLLRAHGIVDTRREGRFVFYSLADEHVRILLDATLDHLETAHA
jgi:ArsR family transcriptional regulator, lead/cadmium/zinc/bismuth-responsive transcriptional repressor